MKYSNFNIIKEHKNCKVLYNSFTKAAILFEKNYDLSFVNDNDTIEKLPKEIKKAFISHGIIIDNDRNELEELKYAFLKKYFEKSALTISLIPTLNCNFDCPYCCEKPFTVNEESLNNYFDILEKFSKKNFKNWKNVHVNLFGGEPLIYYNYAKKYIEWLENDSKMNSYNYSIGLITNGSLLNEENLHFLIAHNLKVIQITLDSDKENHDNMRKFKNGKPSFDLLITKIELVAKLLETNKFFFVLRINLNNTNLSKVKKSLEEISVKYRKNINIMFRVIYNTQTYKEKNSNETSKLEEYIDLGKELGFKTYNESYVLQTCEAANDSRTFYILPDMTLTKCANEIGCDACVFGKILNDGSIQLDSEKLINWFNINYEVFSNEKCTNCKMLPDCLGGCPLYKVKNNKRSCRAYDMVSLPNYYGEINE